MLEKGPDIEFGIEAADLQGMSELVSVIFKVIGSVVWFGVVEPEHVNAVVVIIFPAFFPQIRLCLRVGEVDRQTVSLEFIGLVAAVLCLVQWKKSMTITSSGMPSSLYFLATLSTSSCVR